MTNEFRLGCPYCEMDCWDEDLLRRYFTCTTCGFQIAGFAVCHYLDVVNNGGWPGRIELCPIPFNVLQAAGSSSPLARQACGENDEVRLIFATFDPRDDVYRIPLLTIETVESHPCVHMDTVGRRLLDSLRD